MDDVVDNETFIVADTDGLDDEHAVTVALARLLNVAPDVI